MMKSLEMKKLATLLALLISQIAHAELPEAVSKELQKVGVPATGVSVYVQALAEQPAKLSAPLLAHQASVSLNPASTMKLLTSYAGLALLGPAYRWKTEVYTDGSIQQGVLAGNLYLKGYGDPSFSIDEFTRLLAQVRVAGIQEIKGDLVIDNSYFASQSRGAGSFDNEPARAYNATPNATLIQQKTSSFRFDSDAVEVKVSNTPDLPQIKINNTLKVVNADCVNWRSALRYEVKQIGDSSTVTFSGNYPTNCAERYLELLAIDENNFNLHLFSQAWTQLGGTFNGAIRLQPVPVSASKVVQQYSRTLAQILPDLNKWSNNLMARQVLLSIAAERRGAPATESSAAIIMNQWLDSLGLHFDELQIENGSGLSRIERISAQHLGELLVNAYYSPVMSELMSSLPILAVDGTMQKRMKDSLLQGKAHLKTGSISGVFTLAGYLIGQDGRRYVVVFMANHAKASLTKPAQDALLEWVYVQ